MTPRSTGGASPAACHRKSPAVIRTAVPARRAGATAALGHVGRPCLFGGGLRWATCASGMLDLHTRQDRTQNLHRPPGSRENHFHSSNWSVSPLRRGRGGKVHFNGLFHTILPAFPFAQKIVCDGVSGHHSLWEKCFVCAYRISDIVFGGCNVALSLSACRQGIA